MSAQETLPQTSDDNNGGADAQVWPAADPAIPGEILSNGHSLGPENQCRTGVSGNPDDLGDGQGINSSKARKVGEEFMRESAKARHYADPKETSSPAGFQIALTTD